MTMKMKKQLEKERQKKVERKLKIAEKNLHFWQDVADILDCDASLVYVEIELNRIWGNHMFAPWANIFYSGLEKEQLIKYVTSRLDDWSNRVYWLRDTLEHEQTQKREEREERKEMIENRTFYKRVEIYKTTGIVVFNPMQSIPALKFHF